MRPPSLFACICIFLIGPFYLGPGAVGSGGGGLRWLCGRKAVFRLSVVGHINFPTPPLLIFRLSSN